VAALPGVDPACATKEAAAACGDPAPAECFKGTLAKDAKCETGGQCTSGICTGFTGTACGTCAAPKAVDDACGATDFNCGPGLKCDFGTSKCIDALAAGDDCSGVAAGNCGLGLVCYSDTKVCGVARDIGGVCTAAGTTSFSADCKSNLACVSGKCAADVAPTVHATGDTCAVGDYCKGKCVAFLASGADCAADLSTGECNPHAGLACDATSKKCAVPTALTCTH